MARKLDKESVVRKAVAENVRFIRAAKKLHQKDIADIVGVAQQIVARWERGLAMPTPENLERLACKLGLSLSGSTKRTALMTAWCFCPRMTP